MTKERAAIYKADNWHVDDGVASDGSGRPLRGGRSAGRSAPSTSWPSWPSSTAVPSRAKRVPCCAGRASTRASSPTGGANTARG